MKALLFLAVAATAVGISAPVLAAPDAALHVLGAMVPATATPDSAILLSLLGLAGLSLAGCRPGAVRKTRRRALVSAMALLFPGSAGATPIISEVFFNPTGADDGFEWIEIYNDGGSAVDLSGYSLGWGGADYTTGTLQLSGLLGSGQYFVVGGPTSDASNGNPIFDLAVNFTPDLENSAFFQAADGVALFDNVATAITPTTVPIDAFIYAGAFASGNWNGLLDESGGAGAIDFTQPFFASGYSVEYDGTSWGRQNSPTPNAGTLTVPEPTTGLLLVLGVVGVGSAVRGRAT